MPTPPVFSNSNTYIHSVLPDLRTPKSPKRFFAFIRDPAPPPLPRSTSPPLPFQTNPNPSDTDLPLHRQGTRSHLAHHAPSSSLSSIANQLTGATVVRTPQDALAGLRDPPATAVTTSASRFRNGRDEFENTYQPSPPRSEPGFIHTHAYALGSEPVLRKQSSSGSITAVHHAAVTSGGGPTATHTTTSSDTAVADPRRQSRTAPALPDLPRLSMILAPVPEDGSVYPPQMRHLPNFHQSPPNPHSHASPPQPQHQTLPAGTDRTRPRPPPLHQRQDSATRSEPHPTLADKYVVINERTGRRVTRDLRDKEEVAQAREKEKEQEKEIRKEREGLREGRERPARPPMPTGPPPQLPPGAKPSRHSILVSSPSTMTSGNPFTQAPPLALAPPINLAPTAPTASQPVVGTNTERHATSRIAAPRPISTHPVSRGVTLPPLLEATGAQSSPHAPAPPPSPLMRSASHPHITSPSTTPTPRRIPAHATPPRPDHAPRPNNTPHPLHTPHTPPNPSRQLATAPTSSSSPPSTTTTSTASSSSSATPAPILIAHTVRSSPNNVSTTLVTLRFAYSLADAPDTSGVTLPLEVLRSAGGRLVVFIDECLGEGEGDAEGPGMTDGSSAEESDWENEEYGLAALLRDEYMTVLGMTSPSLDRSSILHDLRHPHAQPFPKPTGVATTTLSPPRPARAALRNQYQSSILYPSPSSPPLPPSPVALHVRRGAPALQIQHVQGEGKVVELTVWVPRDAGAWHVIAARLGSGVWRWSSAGPGAGAGAGSAGVGGAGGGVGGVGVGGMGVRGVKIRVEEELEWAGMTGLREELKEEMRPSRRSRVYI